MILFVEARLHTAIAEYVDHYHVERSHQGLDNELIQQVAANSGRRDEIECRERLGGLLKFYYQGAA